MAPIEPDNRDKPFADTGWGIKPDDQPANADNTASDARTFVYAADLPDVVRLILLQQRRNFNTASRVVIRRDATEIVDVNGDRMTIDGLGFGGEHLLPLLHALGAAFDPRQLRELGPDYEGSREYPLSRAWAWGAERSG